MDKTIAVLIGVIVAIIIAGLVLAALAQPLVLLGVGAIVLPLLVNEMRHNWSGGVR
jgi:hypothetical protein